MNAPVAIVIPALNEAAAIPDLAAGLAALRPAPAEVLLVDGGSTDDTPAIARAHGLAVLEPGVRGRARQINAGVAAVASPLVLVLHADTRLPPDAMAVVRQTLSDPRTALAGFTPVIAGPGGVRWPTTLHNWAKTWYAPALFRPRLFLKGGRLLFGDHAMFFRRADFLSVGGCDPDMAVMEDADLCVRLARLGRVRLVPRRVTTSDRRIAAWGEWRANWIYLSVGARWGLGLRQGLERRYPDVR
jgi:glycosyltransferase involved in cell wall biosynthesis